jgi:hypothetical protein
MWCLSCTSACVQECRRVRICIPILTRAALQVTPSTQLTGRPSNQTAPAGVGDGPKVRAHTCCAACFDDKSGQMRPFSVTLSGAPPSDALQVQPDLRLRQLAPKLLAAALSAAVEASVGQPRDRAQVQLGTGAWGGRPCIHRQQTLLHCQCGEELTGTRKPAVVIAAGTVSVRAPQHFQFRGALLVHDVQCSGSTHRCPCLAAPAASELGAGLGVGAYGQGGAYPCSGAVPRAGQAARGAVLPAAACCLLPAALARPGRCLHQGSGSP